MERCPKCREGMLLYVWQEGRLRRYCQHDDCRAVFDAAHVFLGRWVVLPSVARDPG